MFPSLALGIRDSNCQKTLQNSGKAVVGIGGQAFAVAPGRIRCLPPGSSKDL